MSLPASICEYLTNIGKTVTASGETVLTNVRTITVPKAENNETSGTFVHETVHLTNCRNEEIPSNSTVNISQVSCHKLQQKTRRVFRVRRYCKKNAMMMTQHDLDKMLPEN